jgi:hypothetical protein
LTTPQETGGEFFDEYVAEAVSVTPSEFMRVTGVIFIGSPKRSTLDLESD